MKKACAIAAVCMAFFVASDSAWGQLKLLLDFESPMPTDISGQGTVVTNHGATFVPSGGLEGGAMRFDGVDDYMRVELNIGPMVDEMPQVSFGASVRLDAASKIVYDVMNADDAVCDRALVADARVDGVLRWSAYPGYCPINDGPPIEVGQWVSLCVVYDRFSESMRVYVDGALAFERDAFNGANTPFFNIGRSASFDGGDFEGLMDNVFVFEGVLSDEDVELIHLGGVSAIAAVVPDTTQRDRLEHDNYSPWPEAADVIAAPAALTGMTPIQWHYTMTDPGAGWEVEGFDDTAWSVGIGGFAQAGHRFERDVPNTEWDGSDLWLRTQVTLSGDDLVSVDGAPVVLWGRWDEQLEIWINGVLAVDTEFPGEHQGALGSMLPRYVGLTEAGMAAWREGENTIAARVYNLYGGGYFDVGVVRNPFDGLPAQGFSTNAETFAFMEPLRRWAARSCVPTASLAVMREGSLEFNYTIGHMDKEQTIPAPRDAMFRTASLVKPVTRAAIHRLIEMGAINPATGQPITLQSKFWPMMEALGVMPSPGTMPDPNAAMITLDHLVRHTSQTPFADRGALVAQYGRNYTLGDIARQLYGTPLLAVPCEPTESPVWCMSNPGNADCYRYSNEGHFLLRHFVQLMTGDLASFIETEVVHAADAGYAPMVVSQELLELRDPLEPWYRSTNWWSAGDLSSSYTAGYMLSTSAETYCQLMGQWRLFWGERIPEFAPCNTGYPAKGGWMGGTHTLGIQNMRGDVYAGWALLTNESGQGNFSELYDVFNTLLRTIENSDAWGVCEGDIADDFGSIGFDGQVGFGDFLALLGLVGPCGVGTTNLDCTGDIADDFGTLGGDGMVGFGDFLALLGLVGPCP